MNTKLVGRWGESTAAGFLKKKGYNIIGMGYATRFGEIDIIAENSDYIVFAEVKLRKNDNFGAAKEFVNRSKQEKILITASMWLNENQDVTKQPRFDVIEVYAPFGVNTEKPVINHIENAFGGEFLY